MSTQHLNLVLFFLVKQWPPLSKVILDLFTTSSFLFGTTNSCNLDQNPIAATLKLSIMPEHWSLQCVTYMEHLHVTGSLLLTAHVKMSNSIAVAT